MNIVGKFNADGRLVSISYRGKNYSIESEYDALRAAGFLDLDAVEAAYYMGNHGTGDNGTGYIRDTKTGKPVSAPPAPPVEEEPQELPVDPERLAVYEAMAAQEARLVAQAERITALEAALKAKGGDSK